MKRRIAGVTLLAAATLLGLHPMEQKEEENQWT